jgi:hypothetical protein
LEHGLNYQGRQVEHLLRASQSQIIRWLKKRSGSGGLQPLTRWKSKSGDFGLAVHQDQILGLRYTLVLHLAAARYQYNAAILELVFAGRPPELTLRTGAATSRPFVAELRADMQKCLSVSKRRRAAAKGSSK